MLEEAASGVPFCGRELILTQHAIQRFQQRYAPGCALPAAEHLIRKALAGGFLQRATQSGGDAFRCIFRQDGEQLTFLFYAAQQAGGWFVISVIPREANPATLGRHFKRMRRASPTWKRCRRPERRPLELEAELDWNEEGSHG